MKSKIKQLDRQLRSALQAVKSGEKEKPVDWLTHCSNTCKICRGNGEIEEIENGGIFSASCPICRGLGISQTKPL